MSVRAATGWIALLLVSVGSLPARGLARHPERSFERSFSIAGPLALEAVTNSGRVDIRAGSGPAVTVRGRIKRNVSWRGAQITDDAIEKLRNAPPVRSDGSTIRIERIHDESLWRGVSVDYEIVIPASAKVSVETASGAVSISGSRSDVRIETGSGAIRADVASGHVDVRASSGSVRVSGAMESLAVRTESGSIVAEAESLASVQASSGSGSVSVSGVRGTVRAETGSGRITLDGRVTGDWAVRSRSGSVTIRVPADSRFELSARSRSGSVKSALAVANRGAPAEHVLEGPVNGGGPTLDVETGSSSITLVSSAG